MTRRIIVLAAAPALAVATALSAGAVQTGGAVRTAGAAAAAADPAAPERAAASQPAAADPSRPRWRVVGSPRDRSPQLLVLSDPERFAARGERISLSVKDADLVEVVRSLARIAGLNLVLDPSVRGTVTAELTDVPWDQALAVILKINGLGMELDGRIITVAPPARLYAAP